MTPVISRSLSNFDDAHARGTTAASPTRKPFKRLCPSAIWICPQPPAVTQKTGHAKPLDAVSWCSLKTSSGASDRITRSGSTSDDNLAERREAQPENEAQRARCLADLSIDARFPRQPD
ncbi:hypothetical protein N7492_007383 [Penicillium capsulatum]|uniref:Uncharacterized protein n=1 Tax=Penicillium capsulatum TaxID=69766 RepID=A0A9W9I265_9EURO|nr:hypothetical protein N7492_007383 [Penicillium capsulatum]KAJ6117223.1 hypothetical protein N7512_006948 [Penicillium capsulatum]